MAKQRRPAGRHTKSVAVRRHRVKSSGSVSPFFYAFLVLVGLGLLSTGISHASPQAGVLGTSRQLADKGSDDSGSSDHGGSSGSSSDNGGNGGGGSSSGGSAPSASGSNVSAGSHMGSDTPKSTEPEKIENREMLRTQIQTETPKATGESPDFVQVERKDDKGSLRLKTEGADIELETQDGVTTVRAKQEDGSETELEHSALDDLNDLLKEEDLSVGTSSGGFTIRHRNTQAETTFPLSVNLSTHELTVTTPAGDKVVSVLPDDAVRNLIDRGVISVQDEEVVPLVQQDGEPVFEIHGSLHKKLLGLLPLSLEKKAKVSAQTGDVVSVDESFATRILDILSF